MAVIDEGSGSSRGGTGSWQVSLGGLIVLVLAAGVASGVARSAREAWGTRTIVNVSGPGAGSVFSSSDQVPVERTAGLVLEMADVFLIVILSRGLIGLLRGVGPAGVHGRSRRVWAFTWRIGALCLLLWFLSEESRVLRIDFASEAERSQRIPGWGVRYRLSQGLFPVCGLLAMLGLALGMGAGFLLPGSSPKRRRPSWLFVLLAAVIGVLLVGIPTWVSLIPYVLLVALEAVTNALSHRLIDGPGLSTRLIHAGIEASFAAATCLALALAVARDFERLRRGEPWLTSRAGRVIRLVLLAAAAGGGLTIINVTIPLIHPWLLQGFREVTGPVEAGMIIGGYGLLAAGLAARAVVGAPAGQKPLWLKRLSAGLRLALLGVVLLYALSSCPAQGTLDSTLPPFVSVSVGFVQGVVDSFWNQLPDGVTIVLKLWFTGDVFPWTLMAVVIVGFVLELAIRPDSAGHAPFDRLAESPGRLRPFLWLVLGLTVVCLSALPVLIVAGQVVLHLRLNGADILGSRWAN